MPWLLIPRLLLLPGHQQPLYIDCVQSSLPVNVNNLWHSCVLGGCEMQRDFYFFFITFHRKAQIDGLIQESRNSIANALELHLSCINISKCDNIFTLLVHDWVHPQDVCNVSVYSVAVTAVSVVIDTSTSGSSDCNLHDKEVRVF